jgi:hypothetical protein
MEDEILLFPFLFNTTSKTSDLKQKELCNETWSYVLI